MKRKFLESYRDETGRFHIGYWEDDYRREAVLFTPEGMINFMRKVLKMSSPEIEEETNLKERVRNET